MDLPEAETVNYWQSGRSDPDTVLDRACRHIEEIGGEVYQRGQMMLNDGAVIVLAFTVEKNHYRIVWPVLRTRDGETNNPAARRQAAAFVYHDVKAKVMVAKVLGARAASIGNLLMANNLTIGEMTDPQLQRATQKLMIVIPEGEQ